MKYFAQNQVGKIAFFYVQTAALLSCCCNKLRLFKFVESCKKLLKKVQSLKKYFSVWAELT